jgi:hypothetical protein
MYLKARNKFKLSVAGCVTFKIVVPPKEKSKQKLQFWLASTG